jgi:hypothetical protein
MFCLWLLVPVLGWGKGGSTVPAAEKPTFVSGLFLSFSQWCQTFATYDERENEYFEIRGFKVCFLAW